MEGKKRRRKSMKTLKTRSFKNIMEAIYGRNIVLFESFSTGPCKVSGHPSGYCH